MSSLGCPEKTGRMNHLRLPEVLMSSWEALLGSGAILADLAGDHPAALPAVTGLDTMEGAVWLCVVRHVPLENLAACSRGENAWDKIVGIPRHVCLEQLTFGFAL